MMQVEPGLVSIIIPTYNGAKYLSQAIESALAQTYPRFEVIVVDDGSTDDTEALVRRYPVTYLRQANQGPAVARNLAIQHSRGEYLVFLDHDDRLTTDGLERNLRFLTQHPDWAYVVGACRVIDENNALIYVGSFPESLALYDYRTLLAGFPISPPVAVMFRRSALEVTGGWHPDWRYAADYELYLRVSRVFPAYYHNEIVAEYRRHETNQSRHTPKIIKATLLALKAQWPHVEGRTEYKRAYREGQKYWQHRYGRELFPQMGEALQAGRGVLALKLLGVALRYAPREVVKTLLLWQQWRRWLVNLMPQSYARTSNQG